MFRISNTLVTDNQYNWESASELLHYYQYNDYDLVNAVTGCSIKSIDGTINNFGKVPSDVPENYKYTLLYNKEWVKRLVNFFDFETTRIRIFKQLPKHSTPLHIDKDDKNRVRIIVALNQDEGFHFVFNKVKISLRTGQILIFHPNYLHGAVNIGKKPRYTLNIGGIPNQWLKDLINSQEKKIIDLNV